MDDQECFLRLADIASWPPFAFVADRRPPIVAGVPSLQRGLVWDPGRVEMFWDSLFRGFPVGSFVACGRLDEKLQRTRHVPSGAGVTHHLLDGQQRAQAIGLGFQDPFAGQTEGRVLWLDLAPPSLEDTKAFLFRVTTRAHPWGYALNDRATSVGIRLMRKSLEESGAERDENDVYVRPAPEKCWPIEAGAPVPLAWLLADGGELGAGLRSRLQAASAVKWAAQALDVLDKSGPVVAAVGEGLRRAARRRILCEILPPEVVGPSEEAVSTVERLFHRMNTGGKPLEGDDLAWSLVKARWPDIESTVARLAGARRVPEARLVRLAARLPLMEEAPTQRALSSAVGVDQIRRLSDEQDGPLSRFFLDGGLEQAVRVVGHWMDTGGLHDLPLALQTALARTSPDSYALALWLARRAALEGTSDDPRWSRPVQALVSALRWFSRDQRRAVDAIVQRVTKGPSGPEALRGLLLDLKTDQNWALMVVPRPETVRAVFDRALGGQPDLWKLQSIMKELKEQGRITQEDIEGMAVLRENRDMMLYAQRAWVRRAFPRYDPSDEDTWRDHGRPWDFDHLLPWAAISYQTIPHKDVVKDWAGSVGNLRAWPLEDNRSDGAREPDRKLDDAGKQASSFLNDTELKGIKSGLRATKETVDGDPQGHLAAFVRACSSRIRRMHEAWWDQDGLAVGYLFGRDD